MNTNSDHLISSDELPRASLPCAGTTRLWIDTEFNEFRGDLISMALVAEDGSQWYEVLGCPNPGPWVAQNVMPILLKKPISEKRFKQSLQSWLSQFRKVHIIADWPEDIEHFCRTLIAGPGFRLDTPLLTMEVRRDLDGKSAIPHNALEDARANMAAHLLMERAATAAAHAAIARSTQ